MIYLKIKKEHYKKDRRVAGVVERDGLENRCTFFTGTQGSNP